jgi:nickel-dependent lactate racemase
MTAREVSLAYGDGTVRARIPAGTTVGWVGPGGLAPEPPPAAISLPAADADERRIVMQAIQAVPPGGFLGSGRRTAIVVSDITRVLRAQQFLDGVIDVLVACGVSEGDIDLIFALGAHRRQSREEMESLIGAGAAARVRVHQHDALAADLVRLGVTRRGTPVLINRRVAEADLVVAVGAVTFHDFAGYSGGRKSIVPGVAGIDTIRHNHQLLLPASRGAGRHPAAVPGVREGNPVHEDMLEAAMLLPRVYAVQIVIGQDGRIGFAAAGDLRAAHDRAVAEVNLRFQAPLPGPADLVIAGAGGFPKDVSFYQATRTVEPILRAVRPGGRVVLAAECREGLGDPDFAGWLQRHRTVEELEDALRTEFQVCGFIAYALWLGMEKATFTALTELSPTDLALTRLPPAVSLQQAVDEALASLKPGARVYVMPDAGAVLPTMR